MGSQHSFCVERVCDLQNDQVVLDYWVSLLPLTRKGLSSLSLTLRKYFLSLAWQQSQPFSFPEAASAICQMALLCDPGVLEAQKPQTEVPSDPRMLWLLGAQGGLKSSPSPNPLPGRLCDTHHSGTREPVSGWAPSTAVALPVSF